MISRNKSWFYFWLAEKWGSSFEIAYLMDVLFFIQIYCDKTILSLNTICGHKITKPTYIFHLQRDYKEFHSSFNWKTLILSKGVLNGDKSGMKSRRKEGEKEKKANERREKWKIFLNLITNMPYNKIFWRHERNRFKYIVTFVPSTRLQVWAIQHLLEKHAYIF